MHARSTDQHFGNHCISLCLWLFFSFICTSILAHWCTIIVFLIAFFCIFFIYIRILIFDYRFHCLLRSVVNIPKRCLIAYIKYCKCTNMKLLAFMFIADLCHTVNKYYLYESLKKSFTISKIDLGISYLGIKTSRCWLLWILVCHNYFIWYQYF